MLQATDRTETVRKLVRLRDLTRSRLLAREPHMDLNYLYHRRGIATHMARHAACRTVRDVHRAFARAYEARIVRLKQELRGDAA